VKLQVAPQLLPASGRAAVPWKNGGGLTREVAAGPEGAALGDFDWRASTAEVRSDGPFSIFPGVQRTLCVLTGSLEFQVEGMPPVRLAPDSAPYVFSGDAPAHARPGPEGVVDLNVMTRRGRFAAQVTFLEVASALTRATGAGVTLLFACTPLTVSTPQGDWRLARWDALRLDAATQLTLGDSDGQGCCYVIEIAGEGRSRKGDASPAGPRG
jgi:environmental stress-induced protein Ves